MKAIKILFSTFLISSLLGANFDLLSTYNYHNKDNRDYSFTKIIGIMVEFQYEEIDDPNTTGRGNFLEDLNINLINGNGTRCDGFVVDPPPHEQNYFKDQIKAVNHYFKTVSNGNINIQDSDIEVIETVFQVSGSIRDYSISDNTIGELFAETLELAKDQIVLLLGESINYDDVLFVLNFHSR